MTKTTNASPYKVFNNLILVLLTIILGLNSCQKQDFVCPEQDSIPFIEVKLNEYKKADLDGYFPEMDIVPINSSYGYSYITNTVEYCGQEDFELSDSMAIVVGTGNTLHSFSDRHYYIDYGGPSEDYWKLIEIHGASEDGVLYYTFSSYSGKYYESDGVGGYGTLPLGDEFNYTVEEKDTVALTEDDLLRIFNDALSLNEDGEYVIQEYYTGDVLPAPDSTVITTTYRFYINNIALVSKDDFADHGDECHTL